jgi:hypothetical protein
MMSPEKTLRGHRLDEGVFLRRMNRLFTLVRQPDLSVDGSILYRKAYRAVIFEQGRF